MADWMKEPPKPEELKSSPSWMDAPPTKDELRGHVELNEERPWYDISAGGLARGAIDAIPVVTAVGGGVLGASMGPVGSVGGAGMGYAGGKELADIIKNRFLGDEPTSVKPADQIQRVGENLRDGAMMEMGGQALGAGVKAGMTNAKKAAQYLADKGKIAGRSLYKSGMKNLDLVAQRYGKEPVSDLLMSKGITGSSREIQQQMDALGDVLLAERNEILKGATREGAEVDVKSAVKQAQEYVAKLRKIDNPEARRVADMLQGRIDDYLGAAAKEPEQILRELPYTREAQAFKPRPEAQAYVAPNEKFVNEVGTMAQPVRELSEEAPAAAFSHIKSGPKGWNQETVPAVLQPKPGQAVWPEQMDEIVGLPVGGAYEPVMSPRIATVLDETERIAGPTPLQTSAWKTTAANKVGDAAWQQVAQSAEGKGFDKALSSGLRQATEDSVGKTLGEDAAALLKQKNADLGRILTTQERAVLDAESEARKNALTSVDGMLSTHPAVLATKKLADFSKTTRARTVGGKALMDVSERIRQFLLRQPRFAKLAETNPRAFSALVVDFAKKAGAEGQKAAGTNDQKPDFVQEGVSEEKSRQSFLEGN